MELDEIRKAASKSFAGFTDFSPVDAQNAFFSHNQRLPKLTEGVGVELLELTAKGSLPTKIEPWPVFEQVCEQGHEITEIGYITILCGFEEKNSKQTKRAYDSVSLKVSQGRKFFNYYSNGSRVLKDREYRKTFMAQVLEKVHLPIDYEEKDGHFRLNHASSGELRLWRASFGGLDPAGFFCELPEVSLGDAVRLVQVFLDEFATKKRFLHEWSAGREHGGKATKEPDLAKRIYSLVVAADLPAETYEVDVEFNLQEPSGVESLRRFCGPDDEIFTRLCSFDLPDDNYAEIIVVTTTRGHLPELTLRLPEGLVGVEDKLGLKFQQV